MSFDFRIDGLERIISDVRELGKLPQRSVTKSAKAGGKIALTAARAKAPIDTGELRKGIILKAEKKRVIGKKVYDVMPSPYKNDVFVKMSADGTKRWYYPASQEYGFFAVNGKYIPGFRYLRRAIDENKSKITYTVLDTLGKDIDKVLRG